MYWRKMHKNMVTEGQTLTIITLIIGVIFIFVVLGLNMRKAAMKRTVMVNAADGALLTVASQLSSIGHKLSEDYVGGLHEKCSKNWDLIIGLILVAASLVFTFFSGGLGTSVLAITVMQLATTLAMATGVVGFIYFKSAVLDQPMQFENMDKYFKMMSAEKALMESAIRSAAFSCIDDFNSTQDTNDDDHDGLTNDTILRSVSEYYRRLRSITADNYTLIVDLNQRLLDFNTTCSATDYGNFSGFLRGARDCINPHRAKLEQVVVPVYENGILLMNNTTNYPLSFAEWLEDKLVPLVVRLNSVPAAGYSVPISMYNITFDPNDPNDEIERLFNETQDFQLFTWDILSTDYDMLKTSFNQWSREIIDTWLNILQGWVGTADSWLANLNSAETTIQNCVSNCGVHEWVDCGSGINTTNATYICGASPCHQNVTTGADDMWGGTCCGDWKTKCLLCNQTPCTAPNVTATDCCNTCCTFLNTLGDNTTSQILPAISVISDFRNRTIDFNNYLVNTFIPQANLAAAAIGNSTAYAYPWEDTRGKHEVRIKMEVLTSAGTPFRVPYLQHYSGSGPLGVFTKCVRVRAHHGVLHMWISRWDDEPQVAGWPGMFSNFLDWNMTTTVESWAHYGSKKEETGLGKIPVNCNATSCNATIQSWETE